MQVFFSLVFYNYAHVRYPIKLIPTRGPALRANVKPALSHPVTDLTSHIALASVLRLTIRTIPVPYLVNAQSAATVRCVVTRGKG